MRIALVSTYTHPVALGMRYVSAYLKAAGHDVESMFMCSKKDTAAPDFTSAAMDAMVERCRRADLIAMGVMTNTYNRACVLTSRLRDAGLKTPIVWGATHPTVAREESLEVADAICVGEAEAPMKDLAERMENGRDPLAAAGISFRAGGAFGNTQEVRNAIPPLIEDLDSMPWPDYDLETQWVIEKGELVPARPENVRGALHRLRVLSTRGCPYQCAFCNNATWQEMYKGKGTWVRLRSNENVIGEMEGMIARFPSIEEVNIVDDLFFVRNQEQIDEFVEAYLARVNLPIQMDSFPNTVTEAKVASVARLPIDMISMGIQSGSPRTLKDIFHRSTPTERIAQAIDLFSRYKLRAEYHYIISNPYEPDEQVIETMRFAATHHKGPSVPRTFPLMFYPGSPLYKRARADGRLGPRDEDAYRFMYSGSLLFARHDYLSIWLQVVLKMRNMGIPSWAVHRFIDVVTSRPVRFCIDRRFFVPVAFYTYQIGRKIYKNLVRPFRFLHRKPRHHQRHPEDEVTMPRNPMPVG